MMVYNICYTVRSESRSALTKGVGSDVHERLYVSRFTPRSLSAQRLSERTVIRYFNTPHRAAFNTKIKTLRFEATINLHLQLQERSQRTRLYSFSEKYLSRRFA
jgi:hypothetical protein